MLDESFRDVYTKFKLHFYQEVFSRFQNREASLTAVETFCMEIIMALEEPTINEFASFVNISSPNAAYKVNSLIQKGYVEKIRSNQDRREYHLRPTQKYMDYYNISTGYLHTVMERINKRFTAEEVRQLDRFLQIVGSELMPEVAQNGGTA
ncbi:MarR family transcriptional regulator [bacterium 210917-DFI.7.65]|nr:MarR family transcriptional regulator [bacterium 210917-DFI.7.65]